MIFPPTHHHLDGAREAWRCAAESSPLNSNRYILEKMVQKGSWWTKDLLDEYLSQKNEWLWPLDVFPDLVSIVSAHDLCASYPVSFCCKKMVQYGPVGFACLDLHMFSPTTSGHWLKKIYVLQEPGSKLRLLILGTNLPEEPKTISFWTIIANRLAMFWWDQRQRFQVRSLHWSCRFCSIRESKAQGNSAGQQPTITDV